MRCEIVTAIHFMSKRGLNKMTFTQKDRNYQAANSYLKGSNVFNNAQGCGMISIGIVPISKLARRPVGHETQFY